MSALCETECTTSGELRQRLQRFFSEHGWEFARIESTVVAAGGSTVYFSPGMLERLDVAGTAVTSNKFVLSSAGCEPGDIITSKRLTDILASVYSTGLFETVNIEVDSIGILKISVQEKNYLRLRMGLRFDELFLGEGYMEPAYENLFGYGVNLALYLQYGLRREKYALSLAANPLLTRFLSNALQAQCYVSTEKIPVLDTAVAGTDTFERYDLKALRKIGMFGSVGFQAYRLSMLQLGVRTEQFKIDTTEADLFQAPMTSFGKITSAMLKLSIDNLDRFPFPRNGQKHYICVTGAHDAFGSSSKFLKIDASLGNYATFGRKHTLGSRMQVIWATDGLPPNERSYLGGVLQEERLRDVRISNYIPFVGIRARTLPGEIVLLLNSTYRYTVERNLYAQLTADWGYAWDKTEFSERGFNGFLKKAPLGIGAGLAYNSFLGPLRFTWGRLVRNPLSEKIRTDNLFYVSAGHDF
jgi:outer membrane protein assembly factor BamA